MRRSPPRTTLSACFAAPAILAALAACQPIEPRISEADAPATTTDAEASIDASLADATPASAECPQVRFEAPGLVVRECPATSRLGLAVDRASPPFAWLEVFGEGPADPDPDADGDARPSAVAPLRAAELPGITWRVDDTSADVRYAAESGPTPLAGGDADAALGLTLTVDDGALFIGARLSWPAGARFPAPYHPAVRLTWADGETRQRTAYARAIAQAPAGTFLLTPTTVDGAYATLAVETGGVIMRPAPAADLGPGKTWQLPAVALHRGATLVDAQIAWLAHHPPTVSAPAARWGWRSRRAFGSLVSARALTDVAVSLAHLPQFAPPLIVADGRWFDRYGADSPSPGFPDGVGGAAAALRAAGAELVLRWAPLTVDGLTPLDARDPAIRIGSARRADQLFQAGVSGLAVDLPSNAAVPESFFAALRRVAGAHHLLLGLGEPLLGATQAGRLDGELLSLLPDLPPSPGPDPCGDAIAQASQDRTCTDALRSLAGAPASAPEPEHDARAALAALSAALVDLWPVSGAGRLLGSGGFSVADGTDADARRMAALAALAGGLYLLTDTATTLPPERLELYYAPLRRGLLRWPAARPAWHAAALDAPPDLWHRPGHALAVFNDSALPREFPSPAALAPDLAGRNLVDVFSGRPVPPERRLTVPAGDVRVVVAEPDDME